MTVCKQCKKIHTSLTPKILKNYHTLENLSDLIWQKVSTIYHILNFLGNFCNIDKLSVFKHPHIDLPNKHGKGYT